MFSSAIQPSIISLLSSTGSEPLSLFSTHVDKSLPEDSFVCLLHDRSSEPVPPQPATLIRPPSLPHLCDSLPDAKSSTETQGYTLDQTVLHIQSPTLRTTYIHCPPEPGSGAPDQNVHAHADPLVIPMPGSSHWNNLTSGLGIRHPWIHLQVRNLGREWSFEIGIVDHAARIGVLRLSTFQKEPRLKISPGEPAVLHLPLSFPSNSTRPLTSWSTINLHLPTYIPYFSSPALVAAVVEKRNADDDYRDEDRPQSTPIPHMQILPSGTYSHVSYVRVYATCRIRRIWFGEGGPSQKVPWEFELYSDE